MHRLSNTLLIAVFLLFFGCTSSKKISDPKPIDYTRSEKSISDIIDQLPNYSQNLLRVEGRGRAIISEPGNSERLNISFSSDTTFSLLKIKNRLGIEGGAMLVDPDSILMYFKIDKIAQKVSINDGRLTSINELASINLIDLLHFTLYEYSIREVYEANDHYLLRLITDGGVQVDKNSLLIKKVQQPISADLPYSQIIYENYGRAGWLPITPKNHHIQCRWTLKSGFSNSIFKIEPAKSRTYS